MLMVLGSFGQFGVLLFGCGVLGLDFLACSACKMHAACLGHSNPTKNAFKP